MGVGGSDPLRARARAGEDTQTANELLWASTALTDTLVTAGRPLAGATSGLPARATRSFVNAERMQAFAPDRRATYERCLDLLQRSFDLLDPRTSRVEVPFEGTALPAYFARASAADHMPAPVMIMWNGLDSTKEHMYLSGLVGDRRHCFLDGRVGIRVKTPSSPPTSRADC